MLAFVYISTIGYFSIRRNDIERIPTWPFEFLVDKISMTRIHLFTSPFHINRFNRNTTMIMPTSDIASISSSSALHRKHADRFVDTYLSRLDKTMIDFYWIWIYLKEILFIAAINTSNWHQHLNSFYYTVKRSSVLIIIYLISCI